MTAPPPTNEPKPLSVPKNLLRLMAAITIAMAMIALYANVQKWRRSRIETVTFTPASVAVPSPGSNVNSNNH